jgi:threonine dehydrogenase-like Zn-dependent dehydrogenase
MCLGHEMAGVVEAVGENVTAVTPGDRVVVQPGSEEHGRIGGGGPEGGLTPLLLVRSADAGFLHAVPDSVPLDVAAFAEPLAVGMHAVEQAQVRDGEAVAVFGCGPVGLASVATLVDAGCEQVVAVDLSATRRELAVGLGAQAALDPTTDDVWAALADLHGTAPFMFGPTPATAAFIEASGSPKVLRDILDRGRVGGRCSVVALHYEPVPTSYLMLLMKEFTLRGSMEYPARFADAVDLLARRDLSAVLTDRLPLERFDEALELLDGSKECGKVLVVP